MKLIQIVNNNGCSLPWLHAEVNVSPKHILPCCKYENGIKYDRIIDAWNGNEMTSVRNDFVNGKLPAKCWKCDVAEHEFSYMKWKGQSLMYEVNQYQDVNVVKAPVSINMILSGVCNLACRMCKPTSSSKFVEVIKPSAFLKNLYNDKVYAPNIDVESLRGFFVNAKSITFSGGEPLVDDSIFDIIQLANTESANLRTISFSTNMTAFRKDVIDYLKSLNVIVNFNVSIDGPKLIHEYIRVGCNWNTIVDNIRYLKSLSSKFHFGINTTQSALNVGYIPEFLQDIEKISTELDLKIERIKPSSILETHMHPASLPQHIKDMYIKKLSQAKGKSTLTNADWLIDTSIELMKKPAGNTELFIKFLNEFDLVAKTDYKTVYPEFDF
jgi:MoaA/NifB/PqqE/SkfB family radical SAM enzyme